MKSKSQAQNTRSTNWRNLPSSMNILTAIPTLRGHCKPDARHYLRAMDNPSRRTFILCTPDPPQAGLAPPPDLDLTDPGIKWLYDR